MLKIIEVDRGSAGECAGLLAGDAVVYFNGREAVDILDYAFVESEDNLKITVRRGEREITFAIKKHCGETLGLNFEESAYLNPMQCRNKCVFCFVDQLPKGYA